MQTTMKPMEYRDRTLMCDGVALADIAAKAGTPCYVYSAATILANYRAYEGALQGAPHTICYAMKANGNLAILRLLARAGAGFDIVSGGELYRVLKAGGDPAKVVFSGVGKTSEEIDAALAAGIFAFNCESEPELALVDALAHRRGIQARVALRVNPDVAANTHAHIATGSLGHKFGIDIGEAEAVYEARPPAREPAARRRELPHRLAAVRFRTGDASRRPRARIDRRSCGPKVSTSGMSISEAAWASPTNRTTRRRLSPSSQRPLREKVAGYDLHLFLEPGRSIVGDAGVLLTRVLYRKKSGDKEFVVVDAAMNDLIRPALYDAHHEILPLRATANASCGLRADVVGPVCESGDFLAQDRQMPEVFPGDLLAVCTAGAYGFAQASNYNARPRPAEVLIEDGSWRVIRKRETFDDLIHGEE